MMQVAFEAHCRIHLRQFSAPFLKLARKYFPLDRDIFDFAMTLTHLKGNFFLSTQIYMAENVRNKSERYKSRVVGLIQRDAYPLILRGERGYISIARDIFK